MSYCINGHELDMLSFMYSLVVVISTSYVMLLLLLLTIHSAIDGMEGGYFIACGNNKLMFASAIHSNAHLWIIRNRGAQSSMVLRLSFSLSRTDPVAPTTTGTTFVLTPHFFPTSLARSWYSTSSSFLSSFSLTLTSSGIAMPIICR